MKFLKDLDVGDRFRVAHPEQRSLNDIAMSREELYCVDKVYAASPFVRVCSLDDKTLADRRIRTLMPDVPVLSQKELAPVVSEIEKFLLGPVPKTRAVRYEITWDGTRSLSHLLQPQELKVFKWLWLSGKKFYTPEEIKLALSNLKLAGKLSAEQAFAFYVRHYAELGILVEVREPRSSAARKLREIVGA